MLHTAFAWVPCLKKADGDGGRYCKEHVSVATKGVLAVVAPPAAGGAAADWMSMAKNEHGELQYSGERVHIGTALCASLVGPGGLFGTSGENREEPGRGVPAPTDSVYPSLSTQFSLAGSRGMYHSPGTDWYFHRASNTYYAWDDKPKKGAWLTRSEPVPGVKAWVQLD